MPEFIKTAEVIGNVAEKIYHVGKFVTERLFTIGGWTPPPPSVEPANIQVHESNITRKEE